jgi:NADPH:quinone reductase-like Zn-dependent oxidoreductase
MRFSLGGDIQGCLIEYRTFPSHGVVPIPEHLSYEEASTIPCTGVIAYASLFAGHDRVGPESDVLVLGTGGVSIWGLQLAKAAGARVIATSSNDVKIEKLKELGMASIASHQRGPEVLSINFVGADETINYVKTPDWASEVKRLTGGRGVDHVLEIGMRIFLTTAVPRP